MKNLVVLIFCLVLLLVCSLGTYVFADVFVTIDKETESVIDISNRKDVVMNDDLKRIKLPGRITDYPLQYHATNYFYKNKRFIVDVAKLSAQATKEEESIQRMAEMAKVRKMANLMAKKALEKDGTVFNVLTDKDFE